MQIFVNCASYKQAVWITSVCLLIPFRKVLYHIASSLLSCTGAQPENLHGNRGFVESGHFGKSFIKKKTQENKAP